MSTAKKKVNVADIANLAKKSRTEGEIWTDAIKRASSQIKSGK